MKKKLLTLFLGTSLILGLATGCTNEKKDEPPKEDKVEEQVQGNCTVEECINLIKPEMKLEEVNEIIGFDGEKKDDKETYIWKLTDKTKIEVEYKDDLGTISATYDKDKISDSNFKLSIAYEIQGLLRKGTSFTYEEMVEKLEGIEGHLATNAPTFKRYIWVKDKQTFSASFSDSKDGKCSITSIS
ncbi:MAG: hypothetical protein NC483_03125 [Ruminococcus sp.]|nr:hypothetical protein [Ruminococcus sp.]